MKEPKTFADVISLWLTVVEFAASIQIPTEHARRMKQRDSIPSRYWGNIVTAAEV